MYIKKGLTKGNLEALYIMAFRLYEAERTLDALHCFKLMALLNALDKRAWFGCAACFEILKRYGAAIGCYEAASAIDINDLIPLLRIFHCYLESNQKNQALLALDNAIEAAEKHGHLYSELKEHAINMKNILGK